MELIIGWIVFSFVIGIVGSNRKIGFLGVFFISLLLSPLIGLIFALTSKNKEDEQYKEELLKTVKRQQNDLNRFLGNKNINSEYNFIDKDKEKIKN